MRENSALEFEFSGRFKRQGGSLALSISNFRLKLANHSHIVGVGRHHTEVSTMNELCADLGACWSPQARFDGMQMFAIVGVCNK